QLTALGNVTFDGGSETGQLTAGLLEVGGDFSQLATTSTTSFVASGTHLTRLINANKQVSMASGTATFNDLEVNTAGTATVNGQIQVARDLTVTAGGTLTGNTVVVGRNVSVVAGSFLTVSFLQFSGTLSNAGQFSPGSVWFANPAGGTIPASGSGITYGSVIVGPSGGGSAFSTGGPVSMGGSLTLNSEFIPGGNTVSVGGDFTAQGSAGVLTMTNALDQVTVTGASYFGGGDETGHLTAGTFTSSGRFTQDGTNSPASFVASGTHSVVLATLYSGGNGIDFSDPATSHFQDLHILNLAQITTDLMVNGNLEVNFNQANNLFAKHLTVGGTLTQNGIGFFGPTRLTLLGDLTRQGGTFGPDTTEFTGSAPQTVTDNVGSTSYGIALVQNDVTMSQGLLAASDLTISGTPAFLHLTPSSSINLSGALQVLNQGRLEQTDPAEQITVTGDVTFDGGDETGLLTAGQMVLSGNFKQLATSSTSSFAASGTHQVLFQNASPTITFADPVKSGFQELEIVSGGTVTLGSNVRVNGIVDGNNSGFSGGYTGTFKAAVAPLGLAATWLWSGNTVMDGVTLSLTDPTGSQGTLTNITFQNLPTTATQLSLSHPGAAGFTYTMTGITFMPLGTGANGLYLDVTDYDGVSPVLQVSVSHDPDPAGGPTAGAAHTQTDGIAQVTWLP
ncbi:MAG TPA: hypothetical protein VNH46_00605, partial [Gemmatimonadales bacterium]|nr:hypothetical protein [Gemmatimonadales bacterium]